MDVNLGKEKGKQKLVVYEGESPLLAAKKFAETHGNFYDWINYDIELKEEKVNLLEKLLRQKI